MIGETRIGIISGVLYAILISQAIAGEPCQIQSTTTDRVGDNVVIKGTTDCERGEITFQLVEQSPWPRPIQRPSQRRPLEDMGKVIDYGIAMLFEHAFTIRAHVPAGKEFRLEYGIEAWGW